MSVNPDGTFQGERVLWVGTPVRFRALDRVGKVWLGVGVVCGALLVVSTTVGIQLGNPGLFLFSLMMICFLSVALAAFRQRRAGRRSTRYLITDKQIVATWRWFGLDRVQTAALRDLAQPLVSVVAGSTVGTIRFGRRSDWSTLFTAVGSWGRILPLLLWDVDDAWRVRDIIVAAQAEAR